MSRPIALFAAAILAASPTALQAQMVLQVGETTMGSTSPDSPAVFELDIARPGFLTVLIRPAQGSEDDLVLSITDEEMQALPDARSDRDIGGVMGAEQVVARIMVPGRYRAVVEAPYGYSMTGFQVGASFLPTEMAAGELDPDGRPSSAIAIEVGAQHEDAIDPPSGDAWDWFSFTAGEDGVLTVLTRAVDAMGGDLKIEAFRDGEFREPFDQSDQDQGDVYTNESVNVDVVAGETVYVRVSPAFGGGERVAYRIGSGLIGD